MNLHKTRLEIRYMSPVIRTWNEDGISSPLTSSVTLVKEVKSLCLSFLHLENGIVNNNSYLYNNKYIKYIIHVIVHKITE